MTKNTYLLEINPYSLLDGIECVRENDKLEEKSYKELINRIDWLKNQYNITISLYSSSN